MRDLKILFVKSGYDVPYWPLDRGIAEGFKGVVKQLYVAAPNENIAEIGQKMEPDLVVVFNGYKLPLSEVQSLNKTGIKTAIWMTDDPYHTDITKLIACYYDFVFTQEINCISYYRSLGCRNVFHLPLAADPSVFEPKSVDARYRKDILFVGSAFSNRVSFFDAVAEYLSSKNVLISGLWWDRLSNYPLLKQKINLNHWMSPEETANYYNGAKIVINMHRSHDDQFQKLNSNNIQALSLNPRTFEISACGAFQLTDIREDLAKFYTPGYDIATYKTPNEMIEKIEYYLKYEEERKIMGERAQNLIQKQHSFLHRVSELLDVVFR
ncbi:glycosyltransferase [Aneurinibacillus sp. Ricciae_BoGa-3]|uniref:CgeB family protein n=1 Tax=Aneurinibacillus sp. Ricciae_BoGa-3 TaxID=3022697 RepID=UPI00233FC696|nr:glycosyltransferase [Aneurinibacillus sp. Ricciae_BoGa-3]WCK56170.1 glycosyltransferase [Aneurinibacillus sp. Ricciae_BoGa-3]